jgi:acetyl/propionyl-CoA carboxylase alpha subunit
LLRWHLPTKDVRVDTGVEEGWRVPQQYDSLLAKLVAWGPTREEAIQRLSAALSETVIEGTTTNVGFHRLVAQDPAFKAGDLTTRFIAEHRIVERLQEVHASRRAAAMRIAAALAAAPKGGPSVLYARSLRPPRLEAPR